MSTLTQTRPGTAVPPRLLSVPLAVTFLAEFTSLTSFFLLLSVMPMVAEAAGIGSSGAGLITGSLLLGTVMAEAVAAVAIRRFGVRLVLAAGAVLLGGPALAMLAPESQAVMVSVNLLRGAGFGLCGVVTGTLTATLLPPERRGEGLGLLGLVSGVPAVVALPAGVWLAGHHLAAAAAVTAAAVGLLPLAALRWLPGGRPAGATAGATGAASAGSGGDSADSAGAGRVAGRNPGGRRRSRRLAPALRLPLIFAAATVAAGVLDSFLPLAKGIPGGLCSAALLVQAAAATLSRWQAGKRGDRYGHARLIVPALAVTALGMIALGLAALGLAALTAPGEAAVLFAGMVVFGAGFGVIENATFALMIEQLPEATASGRWNLAYDAGYGAGPAAFGLICGRTGYPAAFALTGALVLAVVPAGVRERRAGAVGAVSPA